jgi:hypothetical protein
VSEGAGDDNAEMKKSYEMAKKELTMNEITI